MASERSPQLPEVIERFLRGAIGEIHTSIPAKVVKWDAAKQRADLQPLVERAYLDEEGARQVEALPVIAGVPVQFNAAKPFRLTLPISDGSLVIDGDTIPATTGTLFFAECSLDRWLSGKGEAVDPEIDHRHALSDAVFIPGLHPFGAPLGSCPTDHATLGHDSGAQIHFRKGTITVGDEAGSKALGLDGDEVDMGTIAAAFGVGPLAACIVSLTITPPGGGAPVVLAVATPGPFPLKGKLVASASQAKGK